MKGRSRVCSAWAFCSDMCTLFCPALHRRSESLGSLSSQVLANASCTLMVIKDPVETLSNRYSSAGSLSLSRDFLPARLVRTSSNRHDYEPSNRVVRYSIS
jgi:hypothetical protein